jgi:hypothetical protein
LVERNNRTVEARGSIPLTSTGDLQSSARGDEAAEADRRVAVVRERAGDRFRLASDFYRLSPGPHTLYGRAELAFLRWATNRGVLAAGNGSSWWRAVNERLLRDKVEARLLVETGSGRASTRSVELWVEFLRAPSPAGWYRAHNASIAAGYLANEAFAVRELAAERFLMNVALVRVLYAHALVAEPRIALGLLGPLGRRLADPRRATVRLFLDLHQSYPSGYPLDGSSSEQVLAERWFARVLDYAVIGPRLGQLYAFAAVSLGEPRIGRFLRDGVPCYGAPDTDVVQHWRSAPGRAGRMVARVTGARRAAMSGSVG